MKNVKVSDKVHAELKQMAKSSGLSFSDIISNGIKGKKPGVEPATGLLLEQMHKRFDYLETLLDDGSASEIIASDLSDAQKFVLEQQKIRAAQRKAAMNPEDNDQSDW